MRLEARDQVGAVIARHIGRDQAISIDQIAAVTGLGAREIKQCVHDLRMLGRRIGSARHAAAGANAGYFMMATAAELTAFLNVYRGQAMTELRLIQAMLGTEYPLFAALERQLALDLGGPNA